MAVPWVTDADLLLLGEGDRVVVDFSDQAVAAGQTNPAQVLKWIQRGARVRSLAQLHAKVFVFGRTAYVGSTNVSPNSALRLSEATIRTTEPMAVSSARRHVEALFDGAAPISKVAARAAQSRYRPARSGIPMGQQPDSASHNRLRSVWRMHFQMTPTASEVRTVEGRRSAVAADLGLGVSDLSYKILNQSIGRRIAASDLLLVADHDLVDGWWLHAEWVLATESLPRGWVLLWTLWDDKLVPKDQRRADRVLAELGLPALERWEANQLRPAKGAALVARLWPRSRLRPPA